jgi:1,4-dihydroxy-2-naphthoyl-CoA synthase
MYASPDSQEARDAFVEKREASFSDGGKTPGGKGNKD